VKYLSRELGWERVRELIPGGVATLDLAVKEVADALWKKVLMNGMSADIAKELIGDLARGETIRIYDQRPTRRGPRDSAEKQRSTMRSS